jgi:hypothetical protein
VVYKHAREWREDPLMEKMRKYGLDWSSKILTKWPPTWCGKPDTSILCCVAVNRDWNGEDHFDWMNVK